MPERGICDAERHCAIDILAGDRHKPRMERGKECLFGRMGTLFLFVFLDRLNSTNTKKLKQRN